MSSHPLQYQDLDAHTTPVECVALNPSEVLLAAASSEGIFKLWDLQQGKGLLFKKFRLRLTLLSGADDTRATTSRVHARA